jgi:transposase-like protein
MADELRMALEELLRKVDLERDADFLREGVRVLSQALLELEVTQHVGAERHQGTPQRRGQRNGYRERDWDTRVGTLDLRVPRGRAGGSFPSLSEPRRRAEQALAAVVQEAYVQGVSTRRVDDLVRAHASVGRMPTTLRPVGAVLAEQHDEWQAGRRSFGPESLAKVLAPHERDEEVPLTLLAAG